VLVDIVLVTNRSGVQLILERGGVGWGVRDHHNTMAG
jgi:hypothetical protein